MLNITNRISEGLLLIRMENPVLAVDLLPVNDAMTSRKCAVLGPELNSRVSIYAGEKRIFFKWTELKF